MAKFNMGMVGSLIVLIIGIALIFQTLAASTSTLENASDELIANNAFWGNLTNLVNSGGVFWLAMIGAVIVAALYATFSLFKGR